MAPITESDSSIPSSAYESVNGGGCESCIQDISSKMLVDATESRQVDAQLKAQMDPKDSVKAHQVDAVAQVRFGRATAEIDGFALVPVEEEELDRERLLVKDKAQVWFSNQIGSGGIGRSVDLTKLEKEEDVPDTERQEKVDKEFMKLKLVLGLGAHDGLEMAAVNYSIAGHYAQVYDKESGELTGEYDLLDKRDIRRLLGDRGMPTDDAYVSEVHGRLIGYNRELKELIKHETGKKNSYSFVSDNLGNLSGHVPFAISSVQSDKVLNKDREHGLYLKTMDRLGLMTTEKRSGLYSDKHLLTDSGAAALNDIERAVALKKILIHNLQHQIAAKEEKVTLLDQQPPTAESKQQIKELKKEIAELTKVYQEIQGANATVLNLALMELNRTFVYDEPVRSGDGHLEVVEKRSTGKELLQPIREEERRSHGADEDDVHGADVIRNNRVDIVANHAAKDVEAMVSEENRYRPSMMRLWEMVNYELSPGDRQVATDVGALIHQVAATKSTDPSRIRLAKFLSKRSEGKYAQESRALAFIVSAVVYGGTSGLKSYNRERDVVAEVLNTSLSQYRDYLADGPTHREGDNADPIIKKRIDAAKIEIKGA